MRICFRSLLIILCVISAARGAATTQPGYEEDVIYGRKDGMALTMDVMHPAVKSNGIGVIFVVSGGWFSAHNFTPAILKAHFAGVLHDRGYTIFAVVHGSQPRYTIPDAVMDLRRAVRFIRVNADRFHVDPDHIGVFGGSAGGHLSLMTGLAPQEGKEKDPDPVERVSSRVQAVAEWFGPTDFMNYGKEGENAIGKGILEPFRAAFDFRELDPKTKRYVQITDQKRIEDMERLISPIYHVSADDPPVLMIHGDADNLVPIQQSETLEKKLKDAKVPVKLIVRKGKGHGWTDTVPDITAMADWFDQYLLKKPTSSPAEAQDGSQSDTSPPSRSSAGEFPPKR